MDLWSNSSQFLCNRLVHSSSSNYVTSDVTALAYKWGVKIKAKPTSVQEYFRQLLIDLREQHPDINAYTLVGKLSELKKFENLSNDLKSFLVRESILFVGNASKRFEELSRTLENQEQQIKSLKELSNGSFSPGPQRTLSGTRSNSGQRSRSRLRRNQLATELNFLEEEEELDTFAEEEFNEDWKFAFEKLSQQISDQKKSITKLSKLSVGSLSAIDRLETQLSQCSQNGQIVSTKSNPQNEERFFKLEHDVHKLARLYKGSQEALSKLEFKFSGPNSQRSSLIEMSPQADDRIKIMEERNEVLQSQVQKLESRLDLLGNHLSDAQNPIVTKKSSDGAPSGMTREEVEQILEEFWLKNQEHFVHEATWEERSSYWEDKFSHGLTALELEVKGSKSEMETKWTSCQEMLTSMGQNSDLSKNNEGSSLDVFLKIEEIKKQIAILESNLQEELKRNYGELLNKLDEEKKNRETGLSEQKNVFVQLESVLQEKDKLSSEKVNSLKKSLEEIQAEVSNNNSESLRQNLCNFETRISRLDEKEKTETQKIENLIGRMTACENSAKDSSTKNFADLNQKLGTVAKTIDENSAQMAALKSQFGALEKEIENSGLKNLNVEVKSKIAILEKRFQEKKQEIETLKINSSELSKNVDSIKSKYERENLRQIEVLGGKITTLEKCVNTQIPRELSKMESMQQVISENENSLKIFKKSLDSYSHEMDKLQCKLDQTISKVDLQSKIDNLETKVEVKFDSALKKSSEAQNCLSEWLSKLSIKCEESEKGINICNKAIETHQENFEKFRSNCSEIVCKSELQYLETKCDSKFEKSNQVQNHLNEKLDILDKNFFDYEKSGQMHMTNLENFCNQIQNKCNDKANNFSEELTSHSCLINMIDLRLRTVNEEITSNLRCLTKNVDRNKSDVDDLFEKFDNQICENVRSESRLSESERWMGEMKTNLSFLISESDLIRGNLKKYQEVFEKDLIRVKESVEQVLTTNEHFKKNFENEVMTTVDMKMDQIETGLDLGFKKIEKDFEVKQKNLLSELDCKTKVSLLDLETQLRQKIEVTHSELEVVKGTEQQFENRLKDLVVKVETYHEMIHSLDKEVGRQLKDLVHKSDVELFNSQITEMEKRANEMISSAKVDLSRDVIELKTENETRLLSYVENFQNNLSEIRQHISNLSSNVGELSTDHNDRLLKVEKISEKISNFDVNNKNIERKISELEGSLQQLSTNAENDRMELFAEIHNNVKNLNENLRHRFEDFSQKFDNLEQYCKVIEGISSALDHLKDDITKLSAAVGTIDANEKKFLGDLHSFTDQMGKNSSQLGLLHAKVDNKEKEMCTISQKMENLTKEFLYFAERIDGSENHLWGDVCAIQEKVSIFEKELMHSAEEWKKSQLVTLQRIEQVNESIKVSDELNECYKERDARKIEYLEGRMMEEKEMVDKIIHQLTDIQNWRQQPLLTRV